MKDIKIVEQPNIGFKPTAEVSDFIDIDEKTKSFGSTKKFKSPEALALAYENLEAEFTRKSQKLKDLEKKLSLLNSVNLETFDKETSKINLQQNFNSTLPETGVEQNNLSLTKNSDERAKAIFESETMQDNSLDNTNIIENKNGEDVDIKILSATAPNVEKNSDAESEAIFDNSSWEFQVSNFLKSNPEAKTYAKEICQEILNDNSIQNSVDPLANAWQKIAVKHFVSKENLTNDDEFLNTYILGNEAIKTRIINNFVKNEIRNSAIPKLISSQTPSSFTVAKKQNIKNFDEARTEVEKLLNF